MKNSNDARQNFIDANINIERIQIKNEVAKFDTDFLIGSVSNIASKLDNYLQEIKTSFGENLIIESDYVCQHQIFVVKSIRTENDNEYKIRIEREEQSAKNKLLAVLDSLNKKQLAGKKLTQQEKNLLNI